MATFRLCDELFKVIEHRESLFAQQLIDSKVLTITLVAGS